MSTGLAKLTRLRELILDVHYYGDVKACLGPHGILDLSSLNELVTLRLPLYFLVEMQIGVDPFVPNLAVVLPASVKHLTVWANRDYVQPSRVTAFLGGWEALLTGNKPVLHMRQSALDFFASVSSRVADHFRHLEEVTYCYAARALRTACQCDKDMLCSRCEALKFLDPYAMDDSSSRMQIQSFEFEEHGIRLRTVQEEVQDRPPYLPSRTIPELTDMFSSLAL